MWERPLRVIMKFHDIKSKIVTRPTLENLLMIRPSGVVSKKAMGALRMLCSRSLCRLAEAVTVPWRTLSTMAKRAVAEGTDMMTSWHHGNAFLIIGPSVWVINRWPVDSPHKRPIIWGPGANFITDFCIRYRIRWKFDFDFEHILTAW